MLRRIGTVVVFVRDMARAKAFYAGTLGLPVARDFGGWVELGTWGATLALHDGVAPAPPGAAPVAGGPHVAVSFEVDSVARTVATLRGAYVAVVRDPLEIAPGRWVANFADPDGNALSVAGGA